MIPKDQNIFYMYDGEGHLPAFNTICTTEK